MRRSMWVIIFAVLVLIGFTGGFYLANFLQKQIQVLIGAAVVLALLTWIGSATDLLGLFRDWVKEKRDLEKVPVLEFNALQRPLILFYTAAVILAVEHTGGLIILLY